MDEYEAQAEKKEKESLQKKQAENELLTVESAVKLPLPINDNLSVIEENQDGEWGSNLDSDSNKNSEINQSLGEKDSEEKRNRRAPQINIELEDSPIKMDFIKSFEEALDIPPMQMN